MAEIEAMSKRVSTEHVSAVYRSLLPAPNAWTGLASNNAAMREIKSEVWRDMAILPILRWVQAHSNFGRDSLDSGHLMYSWGRRPETAPLFSWDEEC